MAIFDRIKYDGPVGGGNWLIYKCPSEEFILGSQLVVNQGQEALFFRGGKALDLFGPGTHTLSTGNLPLLHKLVNLPFGKKTPFTAEVYYINKVAKLDLYWGTPTPIPLEDPKYGLILNVGARGQYGISIYDSRLFVSRIVGAIHKGTTMDHKVILDYFLGLINTKIKTVTAEYMIKRHISFLEITAYLSELSDLFKEEINDEFDRFGVELVNFYCESIAPHPKDYQTLQKYKQELSMGEDFYQKRRSLNIAEQLASNPSAAGISNVGLGMGVGLGVAGQFGNLFAGIGQSIQSNPTAVNSGEVLCPHCRSKNNGAMKFCGSCGNKLQLTVICPHCGKEIPDGMRFCGECGKPLGASKCPACGTENQPGMKFCGGCGQKL